MTDWADEKAQEATGVGFGNERIAEQRRRIAQALRDERERCAVKAEEHGKIVSNEPIGTASSQNIARAIRGTP